MDSTTHIRRAAVVWAVLAIVADLLIGFVLAPHMPPGHFTNTASDQTRINNILALILTPIGVGVITFFVYALITFRQPAGPIQFCERRNSPGVRSLPRTPLRSFPWISRMRRSDTGSSRTRPRP